MSGGVAREICRTALIARGTGLRFAAAVGVADLAGRAARRRAGRLADLHGAAVTLLRRRRLADHRAAVRPAIAVRRAGERRLSAGPAAEKLPRRLTRQHGRTTQAAVVELPARIAHHRAPRIRRIRARVDPGDTGASTATARRPARTSATRARTASAACPRTAARRAGAGTAAGSACTRGGRATAGCTARASRPRHAAPAAVPRDAPAPTGAARPRSRPTARRAGADHAGCQQRHEERTPVHPDARQTSLASAASTCPT